MAEVVREHAEARALLPPGVNLAEAARFYTERHPADMTAKTVARAAEEFIADRRAAECSAIHLRDLGIRLGQFSAAFQMPLTSVSAPLLQQWVYGLKHTRNGQPAASRTKANMLRSVVSLFNWARRMHFIPAGLAVEVAEIPVPKKKPAPVGIYTPDEIRAVLAATDDALRSALAVAAFAGLRMAEVARLDWKEVHLGEGHIVVEAAKAKTAARRIVPICDSLTAWLAPHERPFGPVSPAVEEADCIGNALRQRIERAARKARVSWQKNGFRHSYITYRAATLKDIAAVALECGNSPAVIFSSYRSLATEAEGQAWFDVFPAETHANVVPLAASASV